MSPDAPDLITVSALLARVESRIETLATGWWITGEAAEAKVSAANHCYFTLRDEGGQIRCVLFAGVLKSREAAGDFEFRAGDKLEVAGSLMVYPRSGDLQLRVLRVRRAGMGRSSKPFCGFAPSSRPKVSCGRSAKSPSPPSCGTSAG